MFELQSAMLRHIALGKDLSFVADAICRAAEAATQGVFCSIMIVREDDRLYPLAAPSLPDHYLTAMKGIASGPVAGSCGTAIHRRQEVVVTDIANDPLWDIPRALALPLGLRACWSSPILDEEGRAIATFAFYYDRCRGPGEAERELVRTCVDLCSIAIRRQTARDRITRLAYTDGLTGLLNRAAFETFVSEALARPSEGRVCVLYIDIDDFKSINDTLGHRAGDLLLAEVARRLRDCAGSDATVGRLGGDEFAICQPSGSTQAAEQLARAVLSALARPVSIGLHHILVGVSIGVAGAQGPHTDFREITRDADLALYQAKRSGKNAYCLYTDELGAGMRERSALRADLHRAVASDDLKVAYQPILNVGTGSIQTFEALVRWTHADRGAVSPALFVPLAEENGLITEIGHGVLQRALHDAASWPADVSLAVNVSPIQLKRSAFPLEVAASLARHGLPPSRLEMEITETVFFDDSGIARRTLEELRSLGVRIALDDFGTGYSSLSLLRSRNVQRLKIDKSFVDGLGEDPDCEAIVKGLMAMARSMRIHTTAEGVETALQYSWLEAHGCDDIQGYLIGRPMPAEAVGSFLGAHGSSAGPDEHRPPRRQPTAGRAQT